ncbi:MAG: hypothetical protein HYR85_02540 [Planctomycetes bacterium]|nr:hypothetical protein [Planctomycetota bacterium]MBI3847677.1 hypothetical protein [Planctomycetota bacterium]
MRSIVASLIILVAALVVVVFVGRPLVVDAGDVGGLTGRTHLIVKEHNLKHLSGSVTAHSPVSTNLSLNLVNRSGLATGLYTVPANRVFVLTDVHIESGAGQLDSVLFFAKIVGSSGDRWFFTPDNTNVTDTMDRHFTAGIVFDPNSTVDFFLTSQSQSGSNLPFRIDALGYETPYAP